MNHTNKNRTIVRLKTSVWTDARGNVHHQKSLNLLKRQSIGHNLLKDISQCDYDEVDKIVNFFKCEDGIYELITINVSTDWETGYADDWDYELVPVT